MIRSPMVFSRLGIKNWFHSRMTSECFGVSKRYLWNEMIYAKRMDEMYSRLCVHLFIIAYLTVKRIFLLPGDDSTR